MGIPPTATPFFDFSKPMQDTRNARTQGDATPKGVAVAIHTVLLGTRSTPVVLCWQTSTLTRSKAR